MERRLPREVYRVRQAAFVGKLALMTALTAAGMWLILGGGVVLAIIGTIVVGTMFAHALELDHQCLHGLGVRDRRLARAIGFVLGLPMLVCYSGYRTLHLQHHRDLGTPANREFFDYGALQGKSLSALFVRSLSLRRYPVVAVALWKALRGQPMIAGLNEAKTRPMIAEYRGYAVVVAAVLAYTAVTRDLVFVKVWVLPALLVGECVHFWIELPEHLGCRMNRRNPTENTRSIRGSWFSFWLTNGNNFHVEHHLYPRLPIEALPLAHAAIHERIAFFNTSYPGFWGTLRRSHHRAVETAKARATGPLLRATRDAQHLRQNAWRVAESRRMLVGSWNGAEIKLRGRGVAPLHAVLERAEDGSFHIQPVGDQRVFVNGAPIVAQTLVEDTDVIAIGDRAVELAANAPLTPGESRPRKETLRISFHKRDLYDGMEQALAFANGLGLSVGLLLLAFQRPPGAKHHSRVLQRVVAETVRGDDIVVWYGARELAVIVTSTTADALSSFAARIQQVSEARAGVVVQVATAISDAGTRDGAELILRAAASLVERQDIAAFSWDSVVVAAE